jgi:autotransporter-associated beta strand protein
VAVAPRPASAQPFTWTGGDIGPLWSKDGNWTGDAPPPRGGKAGVVLNFTGLTKAKDSQNNLGMGRPPAFTLSQLALGSTVAQTITGQGLTFVNFPIPPGGGPPAPPSIIQSGAGDFTIATAPITLDSELRISGSGTGAVVLGTGGPANRAAITGAGSIRLTGQAPVSLSGNNDYTGGTRVDSGKLIINANRALGTGTLTLDGGLVRAGSSGAVSIANAVAVNGAAITMGEQVAGLTKPNPLTFAGPVTLASGQHTLTFAAALGDGTPVETTISGKIDGAGGFTKAGASPLILAGKAANTYTGGTTLESGKLIVDKAGALGTGTLTLNGGLIRAGDSGPQTITNAVAVSGAAVTFGEKIAARVNNTLTLSGAVTLAKGDHALTFAAASGSRPDVSTVISGAIGGDGGFTKTGPSTLELAGQTANTYKGTTTVLQGTLLLNKTSEKAQAAIGGDLVIGMGKQTGTVKLLDSSQLTKTANVTINNGTLDLNGKSDTIGPLSGTKDGKIVFGGGGLTVGVPKDKSTTFAGSLSGRGRLTKDGDGTLVLTGNSPLFGPRDSTVNVNKGTLTVDGNLGSSRGITVNVLKDTDLDGNGHISGKVGIDKGTIKAGLVDPTPGILAIDGALSLTRGSTMLVEIAGTTPGEYSQLQVGGPVTLGGSDLVVTLDTMPVYQHAYTIILGLGMTSPTPGFAQGSFVTADFNGQMYRFGIDYAAGPRGTNVDLVDLTRSAVPEPSTLVLALLALVGLGTFLAARSRRGTGCLPIRSFPPPRIPAPR